MPAAPKILGVRVHGTAVEDAEVSLVDGVFNLVPAPAKLGVPLLWKKLSGTGGDDSHIRMSAIVRMMADPDDGFAPPEWQYGGALGPAPPVVLARKDKVPFSSQDWDVLREYMDTWFEEAGEADEGRAAVNDKYATPAAFKAYVRSHEESYPTAFLSLRFPVGSIVVPHDLSATELNGRQGEVAQYSRERVGVRFEDKGVVALRPDRLTLTREASEPPAKRHDKGEGKEAREARAAELHRQELRTIAERFVECLHQDTFPEMGDLHLFGVGGDYRARAQEVLAVWQGAVKCGDVTAESLAEALLTEKQKEYFEDITRKLAAKHEPNSSYARALIAANFAATEWDTI